MRAQLLQFENRLEVLSTICSELLALSAIQTPHLPEFFELLSNHDDPT